MIFDIQRCSYHDGPGIRTTIFFKGCPLRCKWCHNPESFNFGYDLYYDENLCIGCKACAAVCAKQVHTFEPNHKVRFNKCNHCGKCVDVCPKNSLKIFGREINYDEIMNSILSDKIYYDISGGGVTFSGGEPLAQPKALEKLLKLCRDNEVSTCIETSGCVKIEKKIIELVDIFLFDIKLTNEKDLKYYTLGEWRIVEENLEILSQNNTYVILRSPIIPEINDNSEHHDSLKQLKEKYSCVKAIEKLPYHELGINKWKCLGMNYPLKQKLQ